MDNIIEIKNLHTVFDTPSGLIKAVDGLSLEVPQASIVALVGESGCGKSVTALSILRLIQSPGKIQSGEIILSGQTDLLKLSEKEMCSIRGNRIAMIFQEPMTSLNPVFTVGNQIGEAIRIHQKVSRREARARTIEILEKVGISNPGLRVDDYPHQMSGGMRQRIMIAMALSCKPDLLIADEPTTALDVTIQAQILDLMQQLVREMGMSLLLITHDLGLVAEYAEEVTVMYAGKIAERTSVKDLFAHPRHPYTKGLLESIPSLKKKGETRLKTIPGSVPHLARLPYGCSFQERCSSVIDRCRLEDPLLEEKDKKHWVRCWNPF